MPNAASAIPSDRETLNPPPNNSNGDRYEEESPGAEDAWSGAESYSNEQPENDGPKGSRGVKRKRPVTVSCELCKQRKVKCDRAQPSCGWCSRNGQNCEYRERKKPGLRAGYGRELEQRLDRLEEIINSQSHLIETHILHNRPNINNEFSQDGGGVGAAVAGSGGAPSYSSPSEPSAAHGPSPRTALFLHEPPPTSNFSGSSHPTQNQNQGIAMPNQEVSLAAAAEPPPIQNGSHPIMQGGIPSAAAGMSQTPETPPGNEYARNDSSLKVPVNIFANQEQSLADPDLDLPPYDLLYALVDLYFEHINTWCPMLHRRTTLDTLFGPSPLDEADRILLYAIVATTLRFSSDPRLNDANRKRYHDSSKQKVLIYGLENSSVTALQALVILALDLVGSSNGPPGWKLLALISRSVVQLGLAVESTSSLYSSVYPSIYTLRAVVLPEPANWIEDESRRRLFWIMYILDRYATIATAFDFALDEKDIDRKLPCKDEFFTRNQQVETRWFHPDDRADYINQPENVGSFGFYVEILGILSRIHKFLKNPVDIGALSDVEAWQATYRKLDSELTTWEFNLPNEYAHENSSRLFNANKANKTVHCGWVMLHATYQTAVIRLHSSAAYPTTRSPIFTPSYSASQRCLVAVDNILSLTRFVLENSMLDKLGPPFAFTLWVSARLLLVHGSTIAHTVSPDILFFVNTLAEMGKIWKVAERYATILRRVLDEYAEYEQSIGTAGERLTPSTVKILADMRRCAFDLDFLISRQPKPPAPEFQSNSMATAAAPGGVTPSMSARNPPAQNELEYLDVFGFFNVPRLPPPSAQHQMNGSNSAVRGNDKGETDSNLSVQDALNAAAAAEQSATSGSMVNEFNITNYLVPTPETDWLFRASN